MAPGSATFSGCMANSTMSRSYTDATRSSRTATSSLSIAAAARLLSRACCWFSLRLISRSSGKRNDWRRPLNCTSVWRVVRALVLLVSSVVGVVADCALKSCTAYAASCICGWGSRGSGGSGGGLGGGG
eukprot:7391794-Prymnesium_polylepis.1